MHADSPVHIPRIFKYMVGASALFIAGCSAFFSVKGLGMLFVGSATTVMVMAASLEVGKLIAASFLYRYWHHITITLRMYLLLAVLVLIGITSLGNYGYLARAYEQTNSQIGLLEQQIQTVQREMDDTQKQIDGSRNQLGRASDAGRQDIGKLQERIAQSNSSLDQSLARLEDRRKAFREKREGDIALLNARMNEVAGVLKKGLDSEDSAIAQCNEQLAALDRGVEAYSKLGTGGFMKADGVKKAQDLRAEQQPQRDAIAAALADHRKKQEVMRGEHARAVEGIGREIAAVEENFKAEMGRLDTEEQSLRAARAESVASAEKQLAALQSAGNSVLSEGSSQIDGLYQRMRSGNEEMRRLREQIAATDIGSYRFVARAFNAGADDIVKWLILVLVLVFDPLAVCLTVGFNVTMVRGRRPALPGDVQGQGGSVSRTDDEPRSSRWPAFATAMAMAALLACGVYFGRDLWRHREQTAHAAMVPADSFAVLTLRPTQIRSAGDAKFTEAIGNLLGSSMVNELGQAMRSGIDPAADVYAFVKYPTLKTEQQTKDRPVILVGMVARVSDAVQAEAGLSRLAEVLSAQLLGSSGGNGSFTRNRSLVRYGRGRYLDPKGGFFTFALTDREAMVMLEVEGDPLRPAIENEIKLCLSSPEEMRKLASNAQKLPSKATASEGAMTLWFDAARCFAEMPKNATAQARYQQLQRHVGFDLLLTLDAKSAEQLRLNGAYTYSADRFGKADASVAESLAKLGPADGAGIPGRLMDRCAAALDFDSLIENLRAVLGNRQSAQVVVEKSFASNREGQFTLTARYDAQAGSPLSAAFRSVAHAE